MAHAFPRVVAIIQARMGSQRLPGKMLEDLAGQPVIDWVVKRVSRAKHLDDVVVAISQHERDDPLERHLQGFGVKVFRGSEEDVLDRFIQAARTHAADVVVRVCADNPLVSPEEIDRAVQAFHDFDVDYAFNHVPRLGNLYPDGLGAEVIKADILKHAQTASQDARHREHVTSFVWDHTIQFKIHVVACPTSLQTHESIKLDIDTPADLDRMRHFCSDLSDTVTPEAIVQRWHTLHKDQVVSP